MEATLSKLVVLASAAEALKEAPIEQPISFPEPSSFEELLKPIGGEEGMILNWEKEDDTW